MQSWRMVNITGCLTYHIWNVIGDIESSAIAFNGRESISLTVHLSYNYTHAVVTEKANPG